MPGLTFGLLCDGGFAVYLNGVKCCDGTWDATPRLPTGPPPPPTGCTAATSRPIRNCSRGHERRRRRSPPPRPERGRDAVRTDAFRAKKTVAQPAGRDPPATFLRFNRDGQSVTVKPSESLNITGPITIEAVVKPDKALSPKGSVLSSRRTWIRPVTRYDEPAGRWIRGIGGTQSLHRGFPRRLAEWVHLAGVWQEGKMRIYVNGNWQPRWDSDATAARANTAPFWIGSSPFGAPPTGPVASARFASGLPPGLKPRNREAINRRLTGKEAKLAAYWVFNTKGQQEVPDLTGHGNTAATGLDSGPTERSRLGRG